jgi:hypothetical protein
MAGEREQIGFVAVRESQCRRDTIENPSRNADISTLLEPGVPGQPDTSELRDFFAAKARS